MSYKPNESDMQRMFQLAFKVNELEKQMVEFRKVLMTNYTLDGTIKEQEDLRAKCHDLLDLIIDTEASTIRQVTNEAMERDK